MPNPAAAAAPGEPTYYAVVDAAGNAVSYATTIADEPELKARGLSAVVIDRFPGEADTWDPRSRRVVADPNHVNPVDAAVAALEHDPDYKAMTAADQARTRVLVRSAATR